jgi:glutamate 5-kinase
MTSLSNSSITDSQRNLRPFRNSSRKGLTIIIKIGTSSICDEVTHFTKLSTLSQLVETIVELKNKGNDVILVTSGAVGTGLRRLNQATKPKVISKIQAIAAVGQGKLMSQYDDLFDQFNQPIAQVLLTRNDLTERSQYLNACATFEELLNMDVVPIVNENDTISVAELRFGDNDTLSAITAGMVNADYLFLLTDVDALYTDNPRINPESKAIHEVDDISKLRSEISFTSSGSSLGTGGMATKLIAAELATSAGCKTVILSGKRPGDIIKVIDYAKEHPNEPPIIGTHFKAKAEPMVDRKWWIMYGLATNGKLIIDKGAVSAIALHKSSLFAAGIKEVEGNFNAHESVLMVYKHKEEDGSFTEIEIGKGLVTYTSTEINRIKGHKSKDIYNLLGYMDSDFVIHRANIAIMLTDENKRKINLEEQCTWSKSIRFTWKG